MYLDLLLLIFVLTFGLFGFIKGFIYQLFSLAILAGIVLGAEPLTSWIEMHFDWGLPRFVLWGLCAFVILMTGWLLRFSSLRFVQRGPVNAINRWLGFGVGLLKGFVIILFIGMAIRVLPEKTWDQLGSARSELNSSQLLKASADILKWEGIPIVAQLRQLQNTLSFNWRIQTSDPKHPWNWPSEIDSN